tara:strand:+ start:320 stop:562 length:243 start_codon:yes stop_codon:yes gene_type:complete
MASLCHSMWVRTKRPMKSAQLHPNIRYVSLTDDDGDFGILLHHDGSYVYAAVEVDSQAKFRDVFNEMLALRGVRDQLAAV